MKLETFFEKFDKLADTLDGVTKLRQLVLELGVQGRLFAQDSRHESAAEELAEIDLGILELNPRFAIPANWLWAPLEPLLLMMKNGFNGKPNKLGGHYKVTRIETIARGTIDMSRVGFADELPPDVVEKHLIQNGDILFSHINSEPHLGKTAICTFDDPTLIHGVNLLLLRTKPQIDPQFLNTAFKELRVSGYFVSIAQRAINQSSINQKNLGKTLIPIPPLAEQKRIVAKVDELMALCDRLETQQQERETRHAALARASLSHFALNPQPSTLNFLFHPSYAIPPADLRKSILTLAVQGKLVHQDPNAEPAEELFERIQAEREEQEAKGACKSSRPLEPIEETEEPFKLPAEWKWARLRSLVFNLGDGLHGTPEYSDGTDCYFINGNNLVDGQIVIKPHTKTVSLDEAKKHRKPMTLSTVLVSINGTLGSVAFYNNENVILGKSACYFNLATLVDKHFARRVIESPYFVRYASENATGTTIRNLGLKAMNYFPFPLPPLAEQRRIVAKVDQLMALVDTLETQLVDSREKGQKLLEAVVGELTLAS